MERHDPPTSGSEAELLIAFLDFHRDTLRGKTEGLDSAQLGQRLPPSEMTLGGLLKHLAQVEDWWFGQVFADNPPAEPWASADWHADADWEWHSAAQDTPEELRALFDEAVATSDRILHEALAHPSALESLSRRTFRSDPGRTHSLRWILLHLVEEYARHNGHADLLREAVDGQVGE